MFLVRIHQTGKAKFVKQLLGKVGLHVSETSLPEYIITVRDPNKLIPSEYTSYITVNPLTQSYSRILKNANIIKEMVEAPKEFSVDTPVRVVNGEYKDFTGIVAQTENRHCIVQMSVWGKMIKAPIKHADLEPIELPFR